jgi:hypothetical protein
MIKLLLFTPQEFEKFPIPCTIGGIWLPTFSTDLNSHWLQEDAKNDCDANNITYTETQIDKLPTEE